MVAFRIFVLVFLSKDLLSKSRVLVKIGLVRSKRLLLIFFRVLLEGMSFRIVRGVWEKKMRRRFNIQTAVKNWV